MHTTQPGLSLSYATVVGMHEGGGALYFCNMHYIRYHDPTINGYRNRSQTNEQWANAHRDTDAYSSPTIES